MHCFEKAPQITGWTYRGQELSLPVPGMSFSSFTGGRGPPMRDYPLFLTGADTGRDHQGLHASLSARVLTLVPGMVPCPPLIPCEPSVRARRAVLYLEALLCPSKWRSSAQERRLHSGSVPRHSDRAGIPGHPVRVHRHQPRATWTWSTQLCQKDIAANKLPATIDADD